MNMFARFDEIPVMTLQDIKEIIFTEGHTDRCTDRQCENIITSTNKVCGGIIKSCYWGGGFNVKMTCWRLVRQLVIVP